MNIISIIGCVVLAIIIVQGYYIILHYDNIVRYVDAYKSYRYAVDIVTNYIDSTTVDFNDTIAADVRSKRRCVMENGSYVIVSLNGYATNRNNTKVTYPQLINCVIDMTDNYETYTLYNPCLISSISSACNNMKELLN